MQKWHSTGHAIRPNTKHTLGEEKGVSTWFDIHFWLKVQLLVQDFFSVFTSFRWSLVTLKCNLCTNQTPFNLVINSNVHYWIFDLYNVIPYTCDILYQSIQRGNVYICPGLRRSEACGNIQGSTCILTCSISLWLQFSHSTFLRL